jgi:hypothetical protein
MGPVDRNMESERSSGIALDVPWSACLIVSNNYDFCDCVITYRTHWPMIPLPGHAAAWSCRGRRGGRVAP